MSCTQGLWGAQHNLPAVTYGMSTHAKPHLDEVAYKIVWQCIATIAAKSCYDIPAQIDRPGLNVYKAV